MEENRKRGALSVNMTEGSLWKNMLLFSLPLMMTQVLEVLFNLSDVAIAGKFADYLALGAVGLPVFSGYGAGLAKLAGPTGGYLVGYLLMAFIGGLFIEKSNGSPVVSGIGLVLGDAACYVLGTAWFVFQMQCDLGYALAVCVYPFIALDLGKIVVSCIVGALMRKRLIQAGVLKLA